MKNKHLILIFCLFLGGVHASENHGDQDWSSTWSRAGYGFIIALPVLYKVGKVAWVNRKLRKLEHKHKYDPLPLGDVEAFRIASMAASAIEAHGEPVAPGVLVSDHTSYLHVKNKENGLQVDLASEILPFLYDEARVPKIINGKKVALQAAINTVIEYPNLPYPWRVLNFFPGYPLVSNDWLMYTSWSLSVGVMAGRSLPDPVIPWLGIIMATAFIGMRCVHDVWRQSNSRDMLLASQDFFRHSALVRDYRDANRIPGSQEDNEGYDEEYGRLADRDLQLRSMSCGTLCGGLVALAAMKLYKSLGS